MSGIEFIALIGIVASIEQMVEVSGKLVQRAVGFYKDSKELPKMLEELQTFLPGLAMAMRRRSDQSMLLRLSEGDRRVLKVILQNLKDKVQELETLLKDYLPAEDASSGRKLMKAMGSFGVEKKIDKIVKAIFERYIPLLNFATIEIPTLPIELLGRAVESTSLEATTKPSPHYLVKIQRDDDFVGRKNVMDRLDKLLSPPNTHNRVALVALGGIGKTRIALEYALKYKKSRDTSVFWVHASNASRIAAAYDEIARVSNILNMTDPKKDAREKDRMKLVQNWLESEASGRWLLIIDNADDQDLIYGTSQLADYFPRSDLGSIILTTRDKAVGLKFASSASKIITIEALDLVASTALLQGKLGQEVANDDSCQALAEELEGVPLALVQAAAYINEQSITVEEYLALYRCSESSKINLLSEDFEDIVRKAQDTRSPIAATWVISFEIIKNRDSLAAAMLSMMCFMDSQAIPTSLLESGEDSRKSMKALGILKAFSMITPRKVEANHNGIAEKSFDLHRLVRLSMRNWLKVHEQFDLWTAATLKNLAEKYPTLIRGAWEQESKWTAYLPHALALLASEKFVASSADNNVARVFLSQGGSRKHAEDGVMCGLCAAILMLEVSRSLEYLDGPAEESTKWALGAMALNEHILGSTDPETIEAMYQYAKALYVENKMDEAKVVGTRAVQLIATSQQPMSIQTRSVMIQASVMTDEGLFKEAEPLYTQCVQMYKECYGPEHYETLLSMEKLSDNYEDQKRYEDGERLLEEVLKIRKRLSGPGHSETLRLTQNLAAVYFKNGQYEEAARLCSIVYDLRSQILGPKHPLTLIMQSNIAAAYNKVGRYEESVQLALRLSNLQSEVSGSEHPYTLYALSILADGYENLDRYDEAEQLRVQILEARIKGLGQEDDVTVNTMGELAALYERQKKFTGAETLRRQIFQIRMKKCGVVNGKTIQAIQDLFNNYENQRQYHEVIAVGIDLINIREASHGHIQSEAIDNMAHVAIACMRLGDWTQTETLIRSALEHATGGLLEPSSSTTIFCRRILANVIAHKLSDYREAETYYHNILSVWETNPESPKLEVLLTRSELVWLLLGVSRLIDAEKMLTCAEELWSSMSEAEYPQNWNPVPIHAVIDFYQGRHSKSETGRLKWLKEECKMWNVNNTLGVQHLDILRSVNGLGEVFARLKLHAKGGKIAELVRKAHLKLLGPTNSKTLSATLWECWTLSRVTYNDDILKRCLRAKDELAIIFPPAQEDVVFAHYILSRLYFFSGQYAEAEEYALYASSKGESAMGPKHIATINAKEALGAACSAQNKLAESETVLLEALNASEDLLGPQNYLSLLVQTELANTYDKQGREDAAAVLRKQVESGYEAFDWGLSEEQRKNDSGLLEDVIKWLERETSDVI